MNVHGAARVVRVFVSSPSDVAPERGRVQAVAAKLSREYEGLVRFETVLWEEHVRVTPCGGSDGDRHRKA